MGKLFHSTTTKNPVIIFTVSQEPKEHILLPFSTSLSSALILADWSRSKYSSLENYFLRPLVNM